MSESFVHPSAVVEENVTVGEGTKVWHFCHLRKNCTLGDNVSLAKDVFIDHGVTVGDGTRIQNGVSVYHGVQINKSCFIGPHVIFTNDQFPRAGNKNWTLVETHLETASSIGAGAIIRCGVTIGAFAMVGAGAVVTKSIPPFHLAMGVPARVTNKICACGQTQFALASELSSPFAECCKENLRPEIYQLAETCFADYDKRQIKVA